MYKYKNYVQNYKRNKNYHIKMYWPHLWSAKVAEVAVVIKQTFDVQFAYGTLKRAKAWEYQPRVIAHDQLGPKHWSKLA